MPDCQSLFEHEADRYQALVSHEDDEGHLLQTIDAVFPLKPIMDAADIGSGTGRVSFLLAPRVRKVYGVEPAAGMRERALALLAERGVDNVEFREGGYEALPLRSASVDLVIEGWSLLYYFKLSRPDWRPNIERAFAEMKRVLKPGGTIILIETLGTMEEKPVRSDFSRPLYDYCETELGFSLKTIRTDYRFETPAQAVELITFFFGEEMGARVKAAGSPIVPEWTGVWWKNY